MDWDPASERDRDRARDKEYGADGRFRTTRADYSIPNIFDFLFAHRSKGNAKLIVDDKFNPEDFEITMTSEHYGKRCTTQLVYRCCYLCLKPIKVQGNLKEVKSLI